MPGDAWVFPPSQGPNAPSLLMARASVSWRAGTVRSRGTPSGSELAMAMEAPTVRVKVTGREAARARGSPTRTVTASVKRKAWARRRPRSSPPRAAGRTFEVRPHPRGDGHGDRPGPARRGEAPSPRSLGAQGPPRRRRSPPGRAPPPVRSGSTARRDRAPPRVTCTLCTQRPRDWNTPLRPLRSAGLSPVRPSPGCHALIVRTAAQAPSFDRRV